jgi:hypothetical protein
MKLTAEEMAEVEGCLFNEFGCREELSRGYFVLNKDVRGWLKTWTVGKRSGVARLLG